jgi:hypothetical protein
VQGHNFNWVTCDAETLPIVERYPIPSLDVDLMCAVKDAIACNRTAHLRGRER